MKMLEKAGDFALDVSKLAFGGVILSSIMAENLGNDKLYWLGGIFIMLATVIGFMFYFISKQREEKR